MSTVTARSPFSPPNNGDQQRQPRPRGQRDGEQHIAHATMQGTCTTGCGDPEGDWTATEDG